MLLDFLKKKIFFIIAGIVLGVILVFIRYLSENSFAGISLPERTIEVSGPEIEKKTLSTDDLEPLSISLKIQEGVALLEKSPPLETEQYTTDNVCFRHGDVPRMLRKEISFAILDTKTREVFEKRCWFSREDAEQTNILEKLSSFLGLTPEESEDQKIDNELALIVNWWNSHNSDIEVRSLNFDDKPGRFIIVANKYPMLNSHLAYPQDRTGKKYSDIVYVPYSGAIHTQELIDTGRKFLNDNVDRAFSELRELKIKSISYPGKLVVDVIDPTFVKNIFLTEQTDPSLVLTAADGGKALAERVLIRLGTNGEKAYRYTYSSVGALGLGQIMPTTYDNIRRLYPGAMLIRNTDIGRVDIVNGIKATILVFDDHFATVLRRLKENGRGQQAFLKKTQAEIEEMRAAIYNGGPGKINPQNAQISSAVSETVNFVAKFKRMRALKMFD